MENALRKILLIVACCFPALLVCGLVGADGVRGFVEKDGHTGKQVIGSVIPWQIVIENGTSTATYSSTATATYTTTGTTTGTSTGTITATQPAITMTVTNGGGAGTYTVTTPTGATKTWSTTLSFAASDFGSSATGSNVLMMSGSDGQIGSAWMTSVLSGYATIAAVTNSLTATLTSYIPVSSVTGTNTSTSGVFTSATKGFVPAGSGSNADLLRGDGTWGPPGGTVAISDAVVALDANDMAMFRFAETYGSTTYANSVADSNTLTGSGSISHCTGLHEGWSTKLPAVSNTLISGYSKWEYSQFTVAGWFKLLALPGTSSYIWIKYANQNSYTTPYYAVMLYVSGSDLVGSSINLVGGGSVTTGYTIPKTAWPLNEWHHVAVTWDTHYLSLYLNGSLVGQSSDAGGASINYLNHGEWRVGGTGAGSGTGAGQIMYVQDFSISDVARSASYILNKYRREVSPHGKSFSW